MAPQIVNPFVADPDCYALLATPRGPGAIAVIDLIGDVCSGLTRLFPGAAPALTTVSHRRFSDIDDGVVAVLSTERAQLCPHGGERVITRIREWLAANDVGWLEHALDIDPTELFPEASDRVEAFALATLARAASPIAVELLLQQSSTWQEATPTSDDMPRSQRLRRLLVPPRIVVVGAPNAGKSTLSNALVGRTVAITSAQAGTTRDYVAARIELQGLVVDWFDTPGMRKTNDAIEAEAIRLARSVIDSADLIVALAEPGGAWSDVGREPDLRVLTKSDLATKAAPPNLAPDLVVSATTGDGISALVATLKERLVPQADVDSRRPWVFDDRLMSA